MNTLEVCAGMMKEDSKTGMITSVGDKGVLYIYKDGDDLMHMCWKDSNTGDVKVDLVVFPGDASFTKVTGVGDKHDRIHVLEFNVSKSRTYFYFTYMLSPHEDDSLLCMKINWALNEYSEIVPEFKK